MYPCFRCLNIPFRPLQRMTAGMFLAAIAFVMAGFLQLKIDVSKYLIHEFIMAKHKLLG